MESSDKQPGFTLVQLLITIAVLGAVGFGAIPQCTSIVQDGKVSSAVADIAKIGQAAISFQLRTGVLPNSLEELDNIPSHDPWVRQYRYNNLTGNGAIAAARINSNRTPINTLFDIYSLGQDGESVSPLTANTSGDDVVWARDGQFIGLASDY